MLWINLPYACFGAVFADAPDRCTRVAPIGRWMLGKSAQAIATWVSSKGGVVERLP
jgi:hypothetical protein